MAQEKIHKFEYRQFKIVPKSKKATEKVELATNNLEFKLNIKHIIRIKKKNTPVKVANFHSDTAHAGLARKTRTIIKQGVSIDFIRNFKEKTY